LKHVPKTAFCAVLEGEAAAIYLEEAVLACRLLVLEHNEISTGT